MVDSETTSTDTGSKEGTQHSNESPPSDVFVDEATSAQSAVAHTDSIGTDVETNAEVPRPQRNSDIMTSSQFFESERKKSGAKPTERKVPDTAEAERRDAKLREMELLDKNRVEVVPAKKGTNWTPILIVLGLIVVIALVWSWLS
jgi:hypothetical protein